MEIEINTIEDFLNDAFKVQEEIESKNSKWDRTYHTGLAFRGQADRNYE